MLSICIPVYNFDVTQLVSKLLEQASTIDYPIEIIIFDDYSQSYFRKKNSELSNRDKVSYLQFDFNIGRSGIRNRLGDYAQGEWLLFLDCDTMPENDDFLKCYVEKLGCSDVIYGGRTYTPNTPHRELLLRWRYGVKRECSKAIFRQLNPYKSFMSSNFIIKKDVFNNIRFNESLSGYGHEDTLLGIELKHNNISIIHIDNPTIHLGLESASEFIEKTAQGVLNLARILNMMPNSESRKEIEKSIKLLLIFRIARYMGLLYPLRWVFNVLIPVIKKNLTGRRPSVTLFDIYKLSLLAKLYNKNWSRIKTY